MKEIFKNIGGKNENEKRLSPFILVLDPNIHVKRVCQRSTENRRFSPGTPVSSHREY
jgi:hypothetical protein